MPAFGTAGVRGVFNSTQTLDQAYHLAETAGFVFGKGLYGVGWDGRKSSAVLARVVSSAINAVGSNVILFGMVPTPVVAFATRENGCLMGFSVTASHNPPEFSGVKVFNGKGMELSKDDELRIERGMVVSSRKSTSSMGSVDENHGALESYLDALAGRFQQTGRRLRVVVDCANGPGSFVTPHLLRKIGCRVICLNGQVSWRFPARVPEPKAENLRETAAIVAAVSADIGFVHDGDADRLVMINRVGRVVPDSVLSIIALRAMGKNSGSVILSENTSTAVEREAESLGLRVVRAKVGKTFAEIEKEQAVYASEPSKVVDPSWGLWEDGMYCAALITEALTRDPRAFELLNGEPEWKYRQIDLPINVDFEAFVGRVENVFERFKISEVRHLDGVKVIFRDETWIMFRPSGTEAKTRIYCESKDVVKLDEVLESGKRLVEEYVPSMKVR